MKNLKFSVFLLILTHLTIWLGVSYLMLPDPLGLGLFNPEYFSSEQSLWFLLYGIVQNAIMVYSYAHIALPRYFQDNSFAYFLLINVAFLVGFSVIESALDLRYMDRVGLSELYGQDWSSFNIWMRTNMVINGGFMLAANFYGFTYSWFKVQRRRRELEQEKLRAELMALKHQINPHFLFNILNGLYGLAFKHDDEETAQGIAQLSHMMRYMLYESNDAKVPLGKEIEYIENYIALQRLRLDPSVEVSFDVSGEVQVAEIAPLLLIPFVENAFKHGVSTVHPSRIQIRLTLSNGELTFEVSNTLQSTRSAEPKHIGGVGLTNVRKRLELIYKDSYVLSIQPTDKTYHTILKITL
ncbi:histidine kinase [Pontibacter sp. G13]|uniref:sensor histidine kinase n=1 Tax=Pontibacter sp. G13 TaxID=3074898 RepID=UPI00288B784F|nr:histidine kinase [Pontibacter sp. G13]WNJ19542.1 histidine kinase [Pontibacter sp. G13]